MADSMPEAAPVSTPAPPAPVPAAADSRFFVGTRERVRGRSWPMRLLGRFSSVYSAAALIATLATVIGGATVYETRYGPDIAAVMIYQSWWFAGIFVLLAVNIFGAAAVRFPWRRHQYGFVVVHAGLLTLILGFFLAGNDRLDGSLAAPPGHEVSVIELPRDALTVALEDKRIERELQPIPYAGYPGFARFALGALAPWAWPLAEPGINRLAKPVPIFDERLDGLGLRVVAVVDTARPESGFIAADEGDADAASCGPAARLALSVRTPGMPLGTLEPVASSWLSLSGDRVASIGPATATMARCGSPEMAEDFLAAKPEPAEHGAVTAYWHGARLRAEVPVALPATLELAPDLAVTFTRYIPNPRVRDGELVQDDAAAIDPFISLKVGTGAPEQRTWHDQVLSAYHLLPGPTGGPDLLFAHPRLHSTGDAAADVAGNAPGAPPSMSGGYVQMLIAPDRRLLLRWFTRSKGFGGSSALSGGHADTWSGDVVGGETSPMQLRARVDYLPIAISGPEPVRMQPEHKDRAARWIQLEAERGGHRGRAWIMRRSRAAVTLDDGSQVFISYGVARYDLKDRHGFALTLDRFDEGKDPGGEHSASFASDVAIRPIDADERAASERRAETARRAAEERLRASGAGAWLPPALASFLHPQPGPPPVVAARRAHIAMNEPLVVGGVTIYQASFYPEIDEHDEPTGRQVSVFTVAQDRGRWCKYIGSLVLVLGIVLLYLLRRVPARASKSVPRP